MSKLNNITESYVIDKKFQVPKSYNGRVNLDPKENGTFFIQDMIQKMRKRIILMQCNTCSRQHY